jgi:hypothetical protein
MCLSVKCRSRVGKYGLGTVAIPLLETVYR